MRTLIVDDEPGIRESCQGTVFDPDAAGALLAQFDLEPIVHDWPDDWRDHA